MIRFISNSVGVLMVGLLSALIVILFYSTNDEVQRCESIGGKMIGSGDYETFYTFSGDVLIPVTYEIMVCSK